MSFGKSFLLLIPFIPTFAFSVERKCSASFVDPERVVVVGNRNEFTVPALSNLGDILRPNLGPGPLTAAPKSQIFADIDTIWTLNAFEKKRQPLDVGPLFEPMHLDRNLRVRILDMPIKLAGTIDEYRIPQDLKHFLPMIQQIIDFEHSHVSADIIKKYNVYLTIDQSEVNSGETQRKGGAHVDGFQGSRISESTEINHSYIVSNATPTAIYTNSFDFSHLDNRVHNFFQEMDRQADHEKMFLTNPGNIYLLSAYTVHSAMPAVHTMPRTFLRISYDVKPFDRLGNTPNPMLPTNWNMVPREVASSLITYVPLEKSDAKIIEISVGNQATIMDMEALASLVEEASRKDRNYFYNVVYTIFKHENPKATELVIAYLKKLTLSDPRALKLLMVPLSSQDTQIARASEDLIFSGIQAQNNVGSGVAADLVMEIIADPRYHVDTAKFRSLLGGNESPENQLSAGNEAWWQGLFSEPLDREFRIFSSHAFMTDSVPIALAKRLRSNEIHAKTLEKIGFRLRQTANGIGLVVPRNVREIFKQSDSIASQFVREGLLKETETIRLALVFENKNESKAEERFLLIVPGVDPLPIDDKWQLIVNYEKEFPGLAYTKAIAHGRYPFFVNYIPHDLGHWTPILESPEIMRATRQSMKTLVDRRLAKITATEKHRKLLHRRMMFATEYLSIPDITKSSEIKNLIPHFFNDENISSVDMNKMYLQSLPSAQLKNHIEILVNNGRSVLFRGAGGQRDAYSRERTLTDEGDFNPGLDAKIIDELNGNSGNVAKYYRQVSLDNLEANFDQIVRLTELLDSRPENFSKFDSDQIFAQMIDYIARYETALYSALMEELMPQDVILESVSERTSQSMKVVRYFSRFVRLNTFFEEAYLSH